MAAFQYDRSSLVFHPAGRFANGSARSLWSRSERQHIQEDLLQAAAGDSITQKTPAIKYIGRRKNVVWRQPTLIAEIEYRAWTDDGKLRHASYKGPRERQDNAAVYECANRRDEPTE
ncbi:hypothetical protein E0H40_35615 [Rhizobium leguminosarum bv. viciae]|nr:hypothetical protein E0H40_35615 [Rhizobium leguminosarum bv. viciae]